MQPRAKNINSCDLKADLPQSLPWILGGIFNCEAILVLNDVVFLSLFDAALVRNAPIHTREIEGVRLQ